mmetsp:Transcript_24659/g.73357  ORF Transcript_24659/g.73357 Transcript_24659/m.73357 type:complete len:194 (+) Transcript_24659:76-657(+)
MAAANPSPEVDAALRTLAGSSWARQEPCYVMLTKVLGHIVDAPAETKFRHLRTSNASLREKLLDVEGARDFLEAVGFAEEQEGQVLAFNAPSCEGLKAALEALRQHADRERMNDLRRRRDERIALARAEEAKVRPLGHAHLSKERRDEIQRELELDRKEHEAEERLHPSVASHSRELKFGAEEVEHTWKSGGC